MRRIHGGDAGPFKDNEMPKAITDEDRKEV